MEIIKVDSSNKDFYDLCLKLEKFQHNLIPALDKGGYTLTDGLEDIKAFVMYDGKIAMGSIGLKHINDEAAFYYIQLSLPRADRLCFLRSI